MILCPLCYGETVTAGTGSIRLVAGDVIDDIEISTYCPSCNIKVIKGVYEEPIMKKKVSEAEFVRFAKELGLSPHKFADRLKCNVCHQLIWKSTKMPDYEITYQGLKTLVEVKQSHATGRWSFANDEQGVRPTQVEEMDAWEEKHNIDCWMFIVLGAGRAPNGRGAFLIPWTDWKRIEAELIAAGQKSITFDTGRMKTSVDVIGDWQLKWENGIWTLPEDHAFHVYLKQGQMFADLRSRWGDLSKLDVVSWSVAPIFALQKPVEVIP